ncbi:nuclear transport factor 2 family protein [Kitasatospora purpeofusca]|uniref:Nuclear transport factor 2 family protein n=1 Tax=Kitasatospora purpeofusca TaxID=67352 RepID=A0ABZ1UC98_9ACTN|nr:nuclear transport factor 2 family protein [Kitasatospora purpeofusca]
MTATASPSEVLHQFVQLMGKGPDLAVVDLVTTDAVFELPYLTPGVPPQQPGREAFLTHLQRGAAIQRFDAVDHIEVYGTTDPELAVAEYRLHGEVLATGKRYTLDSVMFARVRGGLITWSRVYTNPLDGAVAFGAVDRLLGALRPAE